MEGHTFVCLHRLTFALDKAASTSTKQVFKVGTGKVDAVIPSGMAGNCALTGASSSAQLNADEGGLTVDLSNNTYQGGGYIGASRLALPITIACPKTPAFSYNAGVDTAWFWADDTFRPLGADGKSFQGTRTLPGAITMNADWTFTRQ
jgi:hypothetical protein